MHAGGDPRAGEGCGVRPASDPGALDPTGGGMDALSYRPLVIGPRFAHEGLLCRPETGDRWTT